jgi:SAM-dependent methyltransferase
MNASGGPGSDIDAFTRRLIDTCGMGPVLDVGSGEGLLVSALLKLGVDAKGVRESVAQCDERTPGRFFPGSVLDLTFADDSFDTVVADQCLEHLTPDDIARALQEMRRVARHNVFLRVATKRQGNGRDPITLQSRHWWEKRSFEAGFRKHPAYYRLIEYEALNDETSPVSILLEKVPEEASRRHPLSALDAERDLHMDMLRDTGERSDAHVVRYQWASGFIKPGDRVLDAACGLGYGTHVIAHLTDAESVLGVDGSGYAVDYATLAYGGNGARKRFERGLLPQALAAHPEGSFDAIVSFETLEHVEDPRALLREFHRLLTPGGRVIVSVPNDWSDETGRDPNPHHLHVYDWARLRRELGERLIVEEAFAQTASRCKARERANAWERRPRSLRAVPLADEAPADGEWWLMTAMKTPVGATQPYEERVFRNIAGSAHPSIDYAGAYRNPWLMHALVNVTYRMRNGAEREKLAAAVMAASPRDSNDYAAALCVAAYRRLETGGRSSLSAMLADIDVAIAHPPPGRMGLRWKISLLFVKARMLQAMGRLDEARRAFEDCGGHDVREFGIHLATKTTEAWFLAGKIAESLGDADGAHACWNRGVDYGGILLSASLDDILIERAFPNRFNHGDGVREFALAWDNIARCANGLHLLARGGPLDYAALENSFNTEYAVVVRALVDARSDLAERTGELVETRRLLVERTDRLEEASRELVSRTEDLVQTRATLVERTGLLEATVVTDAARELAEARTLLVERTERLATASRELEEGARRLEAAAQDIAEGDRQLAERNRELAERTSQLDGVRRSLAETTRTLEEATRVLKMIQDAPLTYALRRALRRFIR